MAASSQRRFIQFAPALFVLLWSTGYVGARFALPYAEPLSFSVVRFAIVIGLLTLIALARRRGLPPAAMWGHLAVSGILIHACFIGGIFFAIDIGVDVGVAALIAGIQPLLTAVVAVALLGEVLNRKQWAGFVVGFVGLALVVMKSFELGGLPLSGLIGCVVGLLGITFGTLYQKRYVLGVDLITGSIVQFAAALVPLFIGASLFETGAIEWNSTVIASLAWLCLVLSIGAVSILLVLIREGAAARVSSLFYLVPPVTAAQGYILFAERLSVFQMIGIALAALGVALTNADGATPAKLR